MNIETTRSRAPCSARSSSRSASTSWPRGFFHPRSRPSRATSSRRRKPTAPRQPPRPPRPSLSPSSLAKADPAKGRVGEEVRRLPHLRKGRPEQGRPEPLRRRRPAQGLARGLQLLRRHEGARGETGPSRNRQFITNPKGYVPGTIMAFAGDAQPGDAPTSSPTCAPCRTTRCHCRPPIGADPLIAVEAGPSRPAFSLMGQHWSGPDRSVCVISPCTGRSAATSPHCRRLVWTNIDVRDQDASSEPMLAEQPPSPETPCDPPYCRRARLDRRDPGPRSGAEGEWRHGLSLLGEPKYPVDFPHLDYVNPNAPKGGLVRFGEQGTFDNLNMFVAGVKGEIEGGILPVYDTLMTPALDEVSHGIRPAGRGGAVPGGFPRSPIACARSALA